MTQALNRIRIALNLATMTDEELLQLIVSITALAPKSTLINIAEIATSVAAVTAKGATFKTADEAVTTGEETLKKNKTAKLTARGELENEVTSLSGLVGTKAKDASEVASMAFAVRASPTVTTGDPEVPGAVDVKTPKGVQGRTRATVHETGGTKGRYVAEWSPDPIGTWTPLPGTGKSRTITGASGTKIWVRFARVRGQKQSGWSTPVLLVIP